MSGQLKEVLPKQGQLYQEDLPSMILCKPKLLPLKSVTLEKLERMQQDAEEQLRAQETAARQQPLDAFGLPVESRHDERPDRDKSGSGEVDRLTLWSSIDYGHGFCCDILTGTAFSTEMCNYLMCRLNYGCCSCWIYSIVNLMNLV